MRTVDLYIVSQIPDSIPEDKIDYVTFNAHICTVVTSMKEVKEYIIQRGICDHYEHYINWCDLQEIDPKLKTSKNRYTEDYLSQLNYGTDFRVRKFKYTKEGIASMFRMFNGCLPVGASFEAESEYLYFNELLKDLDLEAEKEGANND